MFQRLRLAISNAFIFTIHRIFMHKESDSQTAERNSAVIISFTGQSHWACSLVTRITHIYIRIE